MAGGMQGIVQRAPDIDAAVTVAIHGVSAEGGGHELHVAHGAGPGAPHGVRRDVAGFEDVQGVQQLGTEERAAAAVMGQRGQRGRHGVVSHVAAIAGFQPPQGDQHGGGHAVALLDRFQQRPLQFQLPLAGGDAAFMHAPVEVLGEGLDEFRLVPVQRDDLRQRPQIPQRRVQRGIGDAERLCFLAQGGQPVDEAGVARGGGAAGAGEHGGRENEQGAEVGAHGNALVRGPGSCSAGAGLRFLPVCRHPAVLPRRRGFPRAGSGWWRRRGRW